jgi:hypothetical protein
MLFKERKKPNNYPTILNKLFLLIIWFFLEIIVNKLKFKEKWSQ